MEKLSVIINTLNEAKNLPKAIESVNGLADEIIVVDMKSIDGTRTIAKKLGAKVFEHKPMGYVEPARNYAISNATGTWILILDADERLSSTLKKTIKNIIAKNEADYYRIPRKNIIFGKWIQHSRWWPDYNIRLFKKGYVEWSEIIHSVPTTKGRGLDIEAKKENALLHFHYESIDQYIERMNRYTTKQAQALHQKGYLFTWKDIIRKPSNEFLSRYFEGQGYRDGMHGLALALLQSMSELVLYLKIWQLEKFKSQTFSVSDVVNKLKERDRESNYWYADTLYKKHGGVINKLKRKFKFP